MTLSRTWMVFAKLWTIGRAPGPSVAALPRDLRRAGDDGDVKRVYSTFALAGVVVSVPALLLLVPGNWFDEDGVGLNHNVEPVDLPDSLHVGLGVLASATLVAALLIVASPAGRRTISRDDIAAAVPLLLAGLYVAFTYRVFTAAVSGANIGGGLLVLLGVVVVPALVGLGLYKAWRAHQSARLGGSRRSVGVQSH